MSLHRQQAAQHTETQVKVFLEAEVKQDGPASQNKGLPGCSLLGSLLKWFRKPSAQSHVNGQVYQNLESDA